MCGVVGSFRDTLCAIVDAVLEAIFDINEGMYSMIKTYFSLRDLSVFSFYSKDQ